MAEFVDFLIASLSMQWKLWHNWFKKQNIAFWDWPGQAFLILRESFKKKRRKKVGPTAKPPFQYLRLVSRNFEFLDIH